MFTSYSALCRNIVILLIVASISISSVAQSGTSATVLPNVIRFSGVLTDADHAPRSGTIGVTFALYQDEQGGSPLWLETQNVVADSSGHYSALLGVTKSHGIPADLFTSGEARWLGIKPEGQDELPRVLLVSVPYALKAGDAETLGGKPLSAFMLNPVSTVTVAAAPAPTPVAIAQAFATPKPTATATAAASAITANYIPYFVDGTGTSLTNSTLFQGANGVLGINTATPSNASNAKLHINGNLLLKGQTTHQIQMVGTASAGRLGQDLGGFFFAVDTAGKSMRVLTTPNGGVLTDNRFVVTSTGNVGIGTNAPGSSLSVVGTVESTTGGFKFPDATVQSTAGISQTASDGRYLKLTGGTLSGALTATSFSGSGTGLTGLSAGNLAGTVPNSSLSGTYSSQVSFTSPANSFSGNGNNLTNLNAGNLTGTLPNGALAGMYSGTLSFNNPANSYSGNGSQLTSLNAGNLTGTVPTTALSGTYSNPLNLSNGSNNISGNGSGLTNINAGSLNGLINPMNLPGGIAYTNTNNSFNATQYFNAETFVNAQGTGNSGQALSITSNDNTQPTVTISNNGTGDYLQMGSNTSNGGFRFYNNGYLEDNGWAPTIDYDPMNAPAVGQLVKFTSTGIVAPFALSDVNTGAALGVAAQVFPPDPQNNNKTKAQIVIHGVGNCTFDNTAVVGDYVTISVSVAGECHDAGTKIPDARQIVGRVVDTKNGNQVYFYAGGEFRPSPFFQKKLRLPSQTAAIPSTSVFTPDYTGMYRVSVYLNSGNTGGGTITGNLSWTDDIGVQSATTGSVTSSQKAASSTVLVRCLSGTPINYSTVVTGTGVNYNIYYTVELVEAD